MIKRPFVTFILVIGTLIASLLWFIQSPQFVNVLRVVAFRYLPKNIGIAGDFSDLSFKFFPPGISVNNPKISLGERNIAQLPAGSTVVAERIDFSFLPFQIFSGNIRVHQVTIVNGRIQLVLDQKPPQKKAALGTSLRSFYWDGLVRIRAEAIALQNVEFNIRFSKSPDVVAGKVKVLKLGQWLGQGGFGYSVHLDMNDLRFDSLKSLSLSPNVESIRVDASINPLGLKLKTFSASVQGLELSGVGQVKGDIIARKGLTMEGSIRASGEIAKIFNNYRPVVKKGGIPTGQLAFEGKFQGVLDPLLESLQGEGQLAVNGFSYEKWKADQIYTELKWSASRLGSEVTLIKTIIQTREKERKGGFQPGEGGKIEVGSVKWILGSSSSPLPLVVPLRFTRAHVHWLGAKGIKNVYPLDFRVSGSAEVTYIPGSKKPLWELRTQVDLTFEKFQLDNQRYQKAKPLSVVFKIPKINLKGLFLVNTVGIRPMNVKLTLPYSQLQLDGKLDFEKGYELVAVGHLNLSDLGQIAETDCRGQGPFRAHIHGPSSAVLVDLDLSLKDAYYLKLFLGDVSGRLTWNDGPQNLRFENVHAVKLATEYSLDGILELGKSDDIDLKVQIPTGDIQDFIQIFGNITRPLSWFPHALNGPMWGNVDVKGGIGRSRLQVLANLKGSDWEYLGERFKSVHLAGGYDRGSYLVSDFQALKRKGTLGGHIAFDPSEKLDWEFKTENFSVGDLDHVAQLDVPIRGKLKLVTQGRGKIGSIESQSEAVLSELSVRGVPMASSEMKLQTEKGLSKIQGTAMGGQGNLDALLNGNTKETSFIHAEFKQLDFSPILLLLNTRSVQDRQLSGYLSGLMDLSFHGGVFERANGAVNLTEYYLARADTKFQLSHPLSIKVTEGTFDFKDLSIKGKMGEVSLNLKNKDNQLEGGIFGNLDTSILEFFTSSVTQSSGTANLNFAINGSLSKPILSGRANMEGGAIRIASLDSPFENVTGKIEFKQNSLLFQNIQADLGGGKVTVNGQVGIFSDRFPSLNLNGILNGTKLKVYPFQYAKVHGTIGVHGEGPPYVIQGKVVVDSALSREKVLSQKRGSSSSLKTLQYAPPPKKQGESSYSKFKLNVEIEAQQGVMIQNDLFRDAQVKGDLVLVNTLEVPRVLGNVEIVHGLMLFKDHVFQIQSATAKFDSPRVINPSFDMNASTEVNGIKIQLYATGRPDKMKFEFTSNPAMQESEILSLLAVGLTSSDAKKLSATDLNAVQQGEAASLVLHSLDFNRDLEDKTGFQVQLDETVNRQQGVSAFRPQSQSDTAAAPQIIIRRKVGERLSLSAGSTVGAGTNKSNQINLDYLVNPDVSITGVFSNYGISSAADTQPSQNSIGLDLKFQKRFK